MTYITAVKSINPPAVNKHFSMVDGKVVKKANANIFEGIASCKDVSTIDKMAELLKMLSEHENAAIITGLWKDWEPTKPVNMVTEKTLCEMFDIQPQQINGKLIEADGKLFGARLKRCMTSTSWLLLDFDTPAGMPKEIANLPITDKLAMMAKVIPGIDKCARIDMRASSTRHHKIGEEPGLPSHSWVQIKSVNPVAIDQLRTFINMQSVNKGLSFPSPIMSRKMAGKQIGASMRTLIDTSVIAIGRIVFCGKPETTVEGYTVSDAGVTIVNADGGLLDIDKFIVTDKIVSDFKKKSNVAVSINANLTSYQVVERGSLTLDTEICSRGEVKSFSEWIKELEAGQKIRCEAPFRESVSEAAFMSLDNSGEPFLYDIGTSTTYRVTEDELKKTTPVAMTQGGALLEVNSKGKYVASYTSVLSTVASMSLAYDAFTESPMIEIDGERRRFVDADYVRVAVMLEAAGFETPSMAMVKDVVRAVMKQNEFDSAIDWLNGLVWDGIDRCSHLFADFFGVAESEYEGAVSRYFASAMAARVLEPGAKCDMVPILVGNQGALKTTAVKALAPLVDTFTEIDLSSRRDSDLSRQLRGKLIGELGELRGLKTKESEWIKAWITKTHEEWTPKFVEFSTVMARRCNFIGTTNEDEFLVDQTGNRRWLPMVVGQCNAEMIEKHRDQIWAQAAVIFRELGVCWQDVMKHSAEVQAAHMVVDDYMVSRVSDVLQDYKFATATRVRLMDIAVAMFDDKVISRADQHRIGDALRHLGWTRKTVKENGKAMKMWVKE